MVPYNCHATSIRGAAEHNGAKSLDRPRVFAWDATLIKNQISGQEFPCKIGDLKEITTEKVRLLIFAHQVQFSH